MANHEIQLQLSTDEINLLLEGLGGMPFVRVFALVGKIQQQVTEQFNGAASSEAESAAD